MFVALSEKSLDRASAHALSSMTRKGLAYLSRAEDSALTDFVHAFFCGDDPNNDTAGKFVTVSVEPSLLNDNH